MVTAYPSAAYDSDGRTANKRARSSAVGYDRLFAAMRFSRRALEPFRRNRANTVREYAGANYSAAASSFEMPVNLLARYVQIVGRSLVPKTPRLMLTARAKAQAPAVSAMQEWVNLRLHEMHFAELLRRWVTDALFSIGVMKVALGTPEDAAVSGYVSPAGEPFAAVVDLDDFVIDMAARDVRQVSFVGHRYRVPYEVASKVDYFDKRERAKLTPSDEFQTNSDGDERIGTVGSGYEYERERDFEEMVDLWEVYLPRTKRIVTFAAHNGNTPDGDCKPLRVQEWVGPDCGPYHYLMFQPVPGNLMPKAPVHDLSDLNRYSNEGYRKLIGQMMRQKSVVPVRGGAQDDAKNLRQASDGETFECENADSIKELSWGGPNPLNAAFSQHLMDLFNKFGGNLDLLAGSNPQSKTATQDKILAQNASAGVADMQDSTVAGVSAVAEALCWFWWYHPNKVMESVRTVDGADDVSITRRLYPAGSRQPLSREGRFDIMTCRIDPYSMTYRTPAERMQFLTALVEKMTPLMPMLAQSGVRFDAQAYIKKIAEYADEPDVRALFTVTEPMAPPGGGGDAGGPAAAATGPREYVRRSVGADTQANRDNDFANQNSMLAAQMQQGQEQQ